MIINFKKEKSFSQSHHLSLFTSLVVGSDNALSTQMRSEQKGICMLTKIQRRMIMELVVHGDNCHKCVHYQTDKCKGKVDDDYCLQGILASYKPTDEEKRAKKKADSIKRYHEKKNDPEFKERERKYRQKYYDKIKDSQEYKERNRANNKRWHETHPNARRERYQRALERKAEELRETKKVRLSGKSKHVPTVAECENCPYSDKCNGGARCVL